MSGRILSFRILPVTQHHTQQSAPTVPSQRLIIFIFIIIKHHTGNPSLVRT